jgi:hypothetical protein
MQRMLLLTPDKADVRGTVALSVVGITDKLFEHKCVAVVEYFIAFALKLSAASKIQYRSMCTDLLATLLLRDWVWSHDLSLSEREEDDKGPALATAMLREVTRRCQDSSAVVRLRALTSLLSIFIHFENNVNAEFRHALLVLLDTNQDDNDDLSLIEVITERCHDDKSLVKAKALQVLAIMLKSSWAVVTDDVVALLTTATTDKSVTVRKQALSGMVALVQSRPADMFVIETFVLTCLPLIYDAVSATVLFFDVCLFVAYYPLIYVSHHRKLLCR